MSKGLRNIKYCSSCTSVKMICCTIMLFQHASTISSFGKVLLHSAWVLIRLPFFSARQDIFKKCSQFLSLHQKHWTIHVLSLQYVNDNVSHAIYQDIVLICRVIFPVIANQYPPSTYYFDFAQRPTQTSKTLTHFLTLSYFIFSSIS